MNCPKCNADMLTCMACGPIAANQVPPSTTNTAAREVVLVPRELPHGLYLTSCQPHRSYGESWSAYYQKWWDNILEKVTLTQQPAASDNLCGLRNEEGMLSGAELESLIDAAQTTTDNKTVAFLGQVARDLLQQLHGVESALLAVGRRPPLCDTENAVRFAIGIPWNAIGEKK